MAGSESRGFTGTAAGIRSMETRDKQRLLARLASGDDLQAETAVRELAAMGLAALPWIEELLAGPEAEVRWWGTRALAEIDAPEATPLLMKALQDADVYVRQCAALVLRQRPAPEAIPALVAFLGQDDRLLGHLAADALVAIGKPAVPALVETVKNGSQAARLEAMRALAGIAEPSSIPTLFKALGSDSAILEYWAGEGLERMGVGMAYFKP